MAKLNGKDIVFSPNVHVGGSAADTFYANGSDYAVCFEWSDGNPSKENRLNRFVQLTDGGNKISFANSTADICGVTTDTAGFVENYGVNSEYTSLVGILGIVTVIDNGSCTVGETCMSDDNGYAVPSSNNMGYRVMARVDANKIKVDVKPNDDMIQRIRTDITELDGKATTNTSDITALKSKVGNSDISANNKTITQLLGNTNLGNRSITGLLGDITLADDKTITGLLGSLSIGDKSITSLLGNQSLNGKTVTGAINELNNNKQNKTDSSLQTSNKTVVGAINELNEKTENLATAYKYKGSVNSLTDLPNSDKIAHLILPYGSDGVSFALTPAPKDVRQLQINCRGQNTSGQPNDLKVEFFKDGETTPRFSDYISFTGDGYTPLLFSVDYTKVGECDTIRLTKNGYGADLHLYINNIRWIDENLTTLGTVIDFDYVSLNEANAGAKAVSSGSSSVLEYKNPKVNVYSNNTPIEIGDVWNIISTDDNYAWTGGEWDKLGGTIDLAGYQTKEDLRLGTTDKTIVGAINELNNNKTDFVDVYDMCKESVGTEYVEVDGWITPGYILTSGNVNTTNALFAWIKVYPDVSRKIRISVTTNTTFTYALMRADDSIIKYFEHHQAYTVFEGLEITVPQYIDGECVDHVVVNARITGLNGEPLIHKVEVEKLKNIQNISDRVQILEERHDFSNLKLNCFGDSFSSSQNSWTGFIANKYSINMVNCSVGGSAMCKDTDVLSFYNRLNTLDKTADGTILYGGHNDAVMGTAIGDFNSPKDGTTIYGGVMRLIEAIQSSDYLQGKPILGVIPSDFNENSYQHMPAVQDALRKIYEAYSIPYVDLKRDCQEMFLWYPDGSKCMYNYNTFRVGNGNTHPSALGYESIAKCIMERGIKKVFPVY